jgi:hypothetical protein
MAVRFSGLNQGYIATPSLGTASQVSITAWCKLNADRNTNVTFASVDDGAAELTWLLTEANGTRIHFSDENAWLDTGILASVGTWYFIGGSFDGATGISVYRALNATSFTTETWISPNSVHNATYFRVGEYPGGGWLNGCVMAVKIWVGTALTIAQIHNEAWSIAPKSKNVTAWYPLLKPETTDYSGNGYTLTGGSGTTTEDGPGVGWGYRRSSLYVPPSAAVVHALTATGLSVSADEATLNIAGALAGTGLTTSSDQGTLTLTHALTAAGVSAGTDSANLTVTIVATGLSVSADSAVVTLTMPLSAIGLTVVYESADLALEIPLTATGLSVSSDSAVLYVALPYIPGPTRAQGGVRNPNVSGSTGLTRAPGQSGQTHG